MATIKEIGNATVFNQLINAVPADKLVVVDFYATWCGPCQMISPFVAQLTSRYRHVQFAKVDVDKAQDVASQCQVSAMPTFQFYKGGKKVAELKGANPTQLEQYVKDHQGSASDSSSNAPSSFSGASGHVDLTDVITPNQMDALNQQEDHTVKNIFKGDASFLESDVDEQLIITVPFNQPVKLHSLKFKVADNAKAPKTIKIYANRQHLGFDDADSIKETQLLELSPKDFEENSIVPLRFVKFQNITSVVLFIVDNQEDEETTALQQLIFIGSPVEATNMGDLKKMGDE
ncbi:thioredoxin-domain-containing protein [Hesseltinella vesiculosa]|uniref:Thioredoxin-domain-containing protein n=1 Tax=Hesseltinella vesiculosa TaxID=101127 RepID=A0A1X2GS57_9FUNG|nr:thioredoxin-domain-containing protein [Hesseltinella vesiculosa]